MVLVKNWQFSHFFYFWQIKPGKCVSRFSRNKTRLSRPKKQKFKKLKKWIFPKGLVHGFGQKSAIFPPFNFRQNRAEKCVLRYSRRKNAFLDYKDKKFTKSKN